MDMSLQANSRREETWHIVVPGVAELDTTATEQQKR